MWQTKLEEVSNCNGEDCVLSHVAQSVYRLDDRGSIPGRDNDGIFSLRHLVHIGSGVHAVSYLMGIGGC